MYKTLAMDAAQTSLPETNSTFPKAFLWKVFWFLLHLGVVYLLVLWLMPWWARWVQSFLLPVLGQPYKPVSGLLFRFSHVFTLSFVPAFVIAVATVRPKHNVVAYVWIVPTLILSYKLLTFPTASVFETFQNHASSAFHYYFGGGFDSQLRSGQEFWWRGMEQLHFTAPFYAGVGYSIAGWIGARLDLRRKITTKVAEWEDAKFGARQV